MQVRRALRHDLRGPPRCPSSTIMRGRVQHHARQSGRATSWQWDANSDESVEELFYTGPPPPPSSAHLGRLAADGFSLNKYGAGRWSQLEQPGIPLPSTFTVPEPTSPATTHASHSLPPAYWSGAAYGPLNGLIAGAPAESGWAIDSGTGQLLRDGAFRLQGNSRAMLVHDHKVNAWSKHAYVRVDLRDGLTFTLDLSNVPCGCLACVYLVAARDPDAGGTNYCDMAENVAPGYGGETCYEIDLLEANSNAMCVCAEAF